MEKLSDTVKNEFPEIRDLGIIGDHSTAALVSKSAAIVWYCPERFDRPSLLAALLDPERGGTWQIETPDLTFSRRRYLEDSAVLETTLTNARGELQITDWMPCGKNLPSGICRRFSPVPNEITLRLQVAPNYARQQPKLESRGQIVQICDRYYLYASQPLVIKEESVYLTIPQGELGWTALIDQLLATSTVATQIDIWLDATLKNWKQISSHITYHGLYERQVKDSIRALRLLTFEENGGIIAAATT
ncbi:MAG TPA: trehalase-like domain-containing protein, partial [Xenococcaceae cyanobacterium]